MTFIDPNMQRDPRIIHDSIDDLDDEELNERVHILITTALDMLDCAERKIDFLGRNMNEIPGVEEAYVFAGKIILNTIYKNGRK